MRWIELFPWMTAEARDKRIAETLSALRQSIDALRDDMTRLERRARAMQDDAALRISLQSHECEARLVDVQAELLLLKEALGRDAAAATRS